MLTRPVRAMFVGLAALCWSFLPVAVFVHAASFDDDDAEVTVEDSSAGESESPDAPLPEESEFPNATPPADDEPDTSEPTTPAEPDEPEAESGPAPPLATESPAKLLTRAYALSKTAEALEEVTAMIELCEAALVQRPAEQVEAYGRDLASWAYNKRGELYSDSGFGDEALADFERSIKLDPTRWKAFHNRAISLAMLGRHEMAMLDFDQAIQLKPNYANAFYNRAELRYERGDYRGAIEDYGSAIRLSPRDSEAYNGRGHAYYKQGELNRALADYDRAIQYDAENAAAYVNRGDAFAETGQYSRAASDYRNAIRIAPALGRAYQSSAWLMATAPDERIRHPQYALDAAKRAIELDGENYRYLDTLAAAYANAGEFELAREAEEKAIALAPPETADAYRARLELYQADQPYRDAPSAPGVSTAGTQPTPRGRGR